MFNIVYLPHVTHMCLSLLNKILKYCNIHMHDRPPWLGTGTAVKKRRGLN